jgi:hypothetical protein
MLDDHGAGDIRTCVAHQIFQQRKFLGRELDPESSTLDHPLYPVEFQVGDGEHRFGGEMTPAYQGANAS